MRNKDKTYRSSFNKFWQRILGCDTEFYDRLDLADFIQLKDALNDINGIIAEKSTLAFIDCLERNNIIPAVQADKMRADVEDGNTDGDFDVQYGRESMYFTPVIAEVKSSIPAKKGKFGAAQEANMFKTIDSLLHGKSKSTTDVAGFYKFLVMPDSNGTRKAMESIVRKCDGKCKVQFFKPDTSMEHDTVYIILIEV